MINIKGEVYRLKKLSSKDLRSAINELKTAGFLWKFERGCIKIGIKDATLKSLNPDL